MVLDDAGQLYVWGYDGCAEGVVPEQSSAWKARRIKGDLEGQKVVAFDAGEGSSSRGGKQKVVVFDAGGGLEVGARDYIIMTISCMIKGLACLTLCPPLPAPQATPYGLQLLAPVLYTLATTRCVWGGGGEGGA